jgi:hypothetical protein
MTAVCPQGHQSSAEDYCDVCGMPIEAAGSAGPASAAPSPTPAAAATGSLSPCPNCGTPHGPDALFCEGCGYDFTTGAMPRPLDPPDPGPGSAVQAGDGTAAEAPTATPVGPYVDLAGTPAPTPTPPPRWVVEVWVDPEWYADQQSPDPMPSAGLPRTVVLTARSALVGRASRSRGIAPDVDCEPDSGVSRRQAQLTTDGTRWWVEDLESANGTFVAPASGPLPVDPIPVGRKHELGPDDRVYLGGWTRLVVRSATEDEQG